MKMPIASEDRMVDRTSMRRGCRSLTLVLVAVLCWWMTRLEGETRD